MQSLSLSFALVSITFIALVSGCSSTTASNSSCTPGTAEACMCSNGALGTMQCGSDSTFLDCECASSSVDAGGYADAGTAPDASESVFDASTVDASLTPTDAGTVVADTGTPIVDAAVHDSPHVLIHDGMVPGACRYPADCDDADACTTDACVEMHCTHTAISCDDSNECTVDLCDSAGDGCYHTPWCNDGISCTSDVCHSTAGGLTYCEFVANWSLCNDGLSCTTDICSPTLDCVHLDAC